MPGGLEIPKLFQQTMTLACWLHTKTGPSQRCNLVLGQNLDHFSMGQNLDHFSKKNKFVLPICHGAIW